MLRDRFPIVKPAFGFKFAARAIVKCEREQVVIQVMRAMRLEGFTLKEISETVGKVNRGNRLFDPSVVQDILKRNGG